LVGGRGAASKRSGLILHEDNAGARVSNVIRQRHCMLIKPLFEPSPEMRSNDFSYLNSEESLLNTI